MAKEIITKHPLDEQELCERFRDGDEDAFGKLYLRYEKPLRKFARGLPGMSVQEDRLQSAAEVVTDAFMNAWKYRATFKPEKKFYTWICEIAKNVFKEMLGKPVPGWKVFEVTSPPVPVGDDGGASDEDPFTFQLDKATEKAYAKESVEDAQAEAIMDRMLGDLAEPARAHGYNTIVADAEPPLTEEEEAERRAKLEAEDAEEDALQERIKEALADGGINSFLKLCQKMFTAIQEDANHPWKYEIQAEAEEAEGELLYDLSKGLFPKHDIELGESGILTEEEIENNRKIILDFNKIYLPHPSYLSTINLVYQKHARRKLSLREVLILYWRRSPKCLIAEKLDMSEDTLKTAISRIRAKFPKDKQSVGSM